MGALALLCAAATGFGSTPAWAKLQFAEVAPPDFGFNAAYQDGAIATDGNGKWVMAWGASNDSGGPTGTDQDIFVSAYTAEGAIWSPAEPLNSTAFSDTYIDQMWQIATDGHGTWVAVWVTYYSKGYRDVWFSRLVWGPNDIYGTPGHTWSPAAPLTGTEGDTSVYNSGPRLATDGSGVWIVASVRNGTATGDGVVLARSTDNGVTWIENTALTGTYYTLPQIACVQGTWTVTGTGSEDSTRAWVVRASSSDGGETWTPWSTATALRAWAAQSVVADDFDHWVLAGTSGLPNWVYVSHSLDDGTWTVPEILNPVPELSPQLSTGSESRPRLATDGADNWVAVWKSNGAFGGALGTDGDIMYSESGDNGQHWSVPAPVAAGAYTDGAEVSDRSPEVAWGSGCLTVCWKTVDSTGSLPLYTLHVAQAFPTPPVAGMTATPERGLTTTEDFGTATLAVSLDAAPTADVTVQVNSTNALEGVVSPASLTFSRANWMLPKTVTLTGQPDGIVLGDGNYAIDLAARSTDVAYNNLPPVVVPVTNRDNRNLVQVQSVAYAWINNRRDLQITITIVSGAGTPIGGATVAANLMKEVSTKVASFSGTTGANGTVVFKYAGAKTGTYSTVVTKVTAAGLTWDGTTPSNSITK